MTEIPRSLLFIFDRLLVRCTHERFGVETPCTHLCICIYVYNISASLIPSVPCDLQLRGCCLEGVKRRKIPSRPVMDDPAAAALFSLPLIPVNPINRIRPYFMVFLLCTPHPLPLLVPHSFCIRIPPPQHTPGNLYGIF